MNRSTRVTFFKPHMDGDGCHVPKPAALTAVLNVLDGKTMSMRAAIARIRKACPDASISASNASSGSIRIGLGPIMLGGHRQNNYRGISFKEAEE